MNNPKPTMAKLPIPTQVETDKMDKVHIQELSYPVLMSYLRSRHVDADMGKRYCKEIWYTFKGKRYFGRTRQTLWRGSADANLKLLPNDT